MLYQNSLGVLKRVVGKRRTPRMRHQAHRLREGRRELIMEVAICEARRRYTVEAPKRVRSRDTSATILQKVEVIMKKLMQVMSGE